MAEGLVAWRSCPEYGETCRPRLRRQAAETPYSGLETQLLARCDRCRYWFELFGDGAIYADVVPR